MSNIHISVYIPSLGSGGADKMALHLCRGLSKLNYNVDLIVTENNPFIKKELLYKTRLIYFEKNKKNRMLALLKYLKKERPKVLLSAKGGDIEAIKAKQMSKVETKVVLRHGTTFTQRDNFRPFFKKIVSTIRLRWLFSKADLIVVNSIGVANDVVKVAKIKKEKVKVLPNPTIVPEIFTMARDKIEHEFFLQKDSYVILGAGGFRKSKDFPTLIKGFYLLQKEVPAKLTILGEGRQRKKIERLVENLGIKNKYGFQDIRTILINLWLNVISLC